jgi:hypothetical protein
MSTPDPAVSGWEAALDELEAHCEHAESLVGGPMPSRGLAEWAPRADLGALPASLVPRALRLASRQRDLLAAMPVVLAGISDRIRLIERVEATHVPPPSLYLDTTA